MSMIVVDEKKLEEFLRAVDIDCYVCPVRDQPHTCLPINDETSCETKIKLYLQNKLIKKEE